MGDIKNLLRGCNFGDSNTIMILGVALFLAFLFMNSDGCCGFFDQGNSIIWIVLIVIALFMFNNDCDYDCC